jgi:hypothetical protein
MNQNSWNLSEFECGIPPTENLYYNAAGYDLFDNDEYISFWEMDTASFLQRMFLFGLNQRFYNESK